MQTGTHSNPKLIVAGVVILVMLAVLVGILHDSRIQSRFLAIVPRADENSVRQALGSPAVTDPSCKAYGTEVSTNCDHVLIYKSAFQPIKPAYWLVFFDTGGHAIATSRQSQP